MMEQTIDLARASSAGWCDSAIREELVVAENGGRVSADSGPESILDLARASSAGWCDEAHRA
jgi:hypothetical protein